MAITTSDLDFANIKGKLKTFLKQTDEFKDYDFEGSGLSSILDVLAYNTHLNGLIANMAVNESFLNSSQLRASALAHAETLGYNPKSYTCARGEVTATVDLAGVDPSQLPASITMESGREFTTSVDGVIYSFYTTEEYIAYQNGTEYQFVDVAGNSTISLIQGEVQSKNFVAGGPLDNNLYIIPDKNVDVNTITVEVYDNFSSTSSKTYSNLNNVPNITDDSRIYMVRETSNGEFELFFSDGTILGQAPVAGNRIHVTYRTCVGSEANGGDVFNTTEVFFAGLSASVDVGTVTTSSGGSEKESLASIKKNAPRAFVAQNRLVTADDYRSLILNNYDAYIRDAASWGGNDNEPPQYGKVFVSLNYVDGLSESAQDQVKTLIHEQLTSNLSIMSIDTVFVEPEFTRLELQTTFQIDATKNISTLETLQTQVNALVKSYVDTQLNKFGGTFRRSNLLAQIDSLSPAIMNSRMSVRMQQNIDVNAMMLALNTNLTAAGLPATDHLDQDFTINFPSQLANPDNDEHTITSSVFVSGTKNVVIKNLLGSTRLQLLDLNGVLVTDNIGYYDPAKGLVKLSALRIESTGFSGANIRISGTPANQSTVRPLRNYILTLDDTISVSRGELDTGEIKVLL